MRVIKSVIKVLIIIIFLQFIMFPAEVNAAKPPAKNKSIWDEMSSQSKEFFDKIDQVDQDDIDTTEVRRTAGSMFNVAFAIGVVLSVVIGGILGIKFMIASAEDKAKIKEMMIPYVVGCVVVFGAFGIWKLVVTLLNGMDL